MRETVEKILCFVGMWLLFCALPWFGVIHDLRVGGSDAVGIFEYGYSTILTLGCVYVTFWLFGFSFKKSLKLPQKFVLLLVVFSAIYLGAYYFILATFSQDQIDRVAYPLLIIVVFVMIFVIYRYQSFLKSQNKSGKSEKDAEIDAKLVSTPANDPLDMRKYLALLK